MIESRWEIRIGSPVVSKKDRRQRLGEVTLVLMNPKGQVKGIVVRVGRLHRRNLIVPATWIEDADEEQICLTVGKEALESLPVYRSDDDLAEDLDFALRTDEILGNTDYRNISTIVQDGKVKLLGHVTTLTHEDRAANVASAIPGVLGVENNLVVDWDLVAEVSRAIRGNILSRSDKVSISAQHGFITLTGRVANAAIAEAAGSAAANIPQVRGVANFLQAPGVVVNPEDEQCLIQPEIGEEVCAADMQLGYVKQVVINPHNRCVTDFILHSDISDRINADAAEASDELLPEERDIVLPASTIIYEGDEVIRLGISGTAAARYHNFSFSDFASPPADWKPPYPYRPEDVLFTRACVQQPNRSASVRGRNFIKSAHRNRSHEVLAIKE